MIFKIGVKSQSSGDFPSIASYEHIVKDWRPLTVGFVELEAMSRKVNKSLSKQEVLSTKLVHSREEYVHRCWRVPANGQTGVSALTSNWWFTRCAVALKSKRLQKLWCTYYGSALEKVIEVDKPWCPGASRIRATLFCNLCRYGNDSAYIASAYIASRSQMAMWGKSTSDLHLHGERHSSM